MTANGESPLIIDIKKRSLKAAEAALGKKAKDVVVLDVQELSTIADYFVICSGDNPAQIRAIADAVEESLSKSKIYPIGREGMDFAHWVLIDYGDMVIHIFDEETRTFYDLEKLWIDAPRVPLGKKEK